ncbi:MAG TPA: DUF6624 domain-containing protein [Candidatus Paceibacterota bacterium]|nr:DUF6624 domain-containing protein [Candidatus Paceibacterota bacterium]
MQNITTLIQTMYEVDQGARLKAAAEQSQSGEIGVYHYLIYLIDFTHRQRIRELIEGNGYEALNCLDDETRKKLWLLVQHQDLDVDLQKKCLEYVHFAPEDFAHLTDRVLINEGKPQRYGTQYTVDEKGNETLAEMEDPDKLGKRRAEIGWVDSEKDTDF